MKKFYLIIFIIFCLVFSFSFVNFTNEFYPSYSFIQLPDILKDYSNYTWYSFKSIGDKFETTNNVKSKNFNSFSNLFVDNREYVFNYLKEHDTNDLRFMIRTYTSNENIEADYIQGFIKTNNSIYRSLKENQPKDLLLKSKKVLIQECECLNSMLENYYKYSLTNDANYYNNASSINNNVLNPIIKEKHRVLINLFEDIGMDYEILESGTLRYGYTKHKIGIFSN